MHSVPLRIVKLNLTWLKTENSITSYRILEIFELAIAFFAFLFFSFKVCIRVQNAEIGSETSRPTTVPEIKARNHRVVKSKEQIWLTLVLSYNCWLDVNKIDAKLKDGLREHKQLILKSKKSSTWNLDAKEKWKDNVWDCIKMKVPRLASIEEEEEDDGRRLEMVRSERGFRFLSLPLEFFISTIEFLRAWKSLTPTSHAFFCYILVSHGGKCQLENNHLLMPFPWIICQYRFKCVYRSYLSSNLFSGKV